MKKIFFLPLILVVVCIYAQPSSVLKTHAPDYGSEPLQFGKFQETPLANVQPKGWLLEFLKRQGSGMTGHPEVLQYPYNSCLWAGIITHDGQKKGSDWWRYEQTAYYTDGLLRCGYLLRDTSLISKAREGILYTLEHPQVNGRLGPDFFKSQWPIAVFFSCTTGRVQCYRRSKNNYSAASSLPELYP